MSSAGSNFATGKGSAGLFPTTSTGAGTYYSPEQTNYAHRGLVLGVNVTADGGTGSVLVTIQGKDVCSGAYFDILATAAVNVAACASGPKTLKVYPGLPVTTNVSANDLLPFTWRVKAVVTGTITGTVGATLML